MLNQTSSNSQGLFNVLTAFSTAFLGKLCLVNGMSGIDQQVVYYTHTFALLLLFDCIEAISSNFRQAFS